MWYWVFLQLPLHGRLLRHGCPGLTTEQDTAHKGTEKAFHRPLVDPRRGRANKEAPSPLQAYMRPPYVYQGKSLPRRPCQRSGDSPESCKPLSPTGVGKLADLVILGGNPLADIRTSYFPLPTLCGTKRPRRYPHSLTCIPESRVSGWRVSDDF